MKSDMMKMDERMRLWLHLVGTHCGIYNPDCTMQELIEIHKHEHDGPGTIRSHDRYDLFYSLKKVGRVLSESED